jgi:hypothetical protein
MVSLRGVGDTFDVGRVSKAVTPLTAWADKDNATYRTVCSSGFLL